MTVSEDRQAARAYSNPAYFCNRELSWLQFNDRVLQEAFDPRTPLLERLKFLAIYSSNLDEFFMVRVSTLLEQKDAKVTSLTADGRSPQQQLSEIYDHLLPVVTRQHQHLRKSLQPELEKEGIYLVGCDRLNQTQKTYLKDFFRDQVYPILTPLGIDPSHPFPRMSNLSFNIAVEAIDPETEMLHFSRIKVPSNLPRFIELPQELRQIDSASHNTSDISWLGVTLEDVIIQNLGQLYPGMTIQNTGLFRITRDADFPVREDESDDLLLSIQQEISKRRLDGDVIRLEVQRGFPQQMLTLLKEECSLTPNQIYTLDGLLDLTALFFFLSISRPDLKDNPWTPQVPSRIKALNDVRENPEDGSNMFSLIRQGDLLVHHPYECFQASVERLLTDAAADPKVKAIKMTLYRTSGDSPVVKALLDAVANRKQVVVLVELKARFDEANNIHWAKRLEQAGIHVVYGVLGLKTHTKTMLIVRQEEDKIRRYVHIGTGNYNSKTAKLYTDLGLMSCREDIGTDLSELFNYLTAFSHQQAYRKLLIAPATLRDRMQNLIRRETDHCRNGKPGRIIAKMNSLVDADIIKLLYEASEAGVEIDLIVRGICCLKPGLEGISENIRVISIVGRLLEHSRIFYFGNNDDEEIFIGSADWMPRNLDRRVEAVVPIEDPALIAHLKELLEIFMSDNRHAWEMQTDGSYLQRQPKADDAERSAQDELMQRAVEQKLAG